MTSVLAADLGASSVRVLSGQFAGDTVRLTELHRAPNDPITVNGTLHWDILRLYAAILDGLRAAAAQGIDPGSLGVDSWAVDYGLIDRDGALLGNPVHYRDTRTQGIVEQVLATLGAERLYTATGIQVIPINTIYQLAAARGSAQLAAARHLLMIPDLINYWLTGEIGAESTNASSTQLFHLDTHDWAGEFITELGIDRSLFAPIRSAGEKLAGLRGDVAEAVGLRAGTPVIEVCSHDTASAVVAVPAQTDKFAYISCGTWSLVGVELDQPVRTPESRAANFTNERGIDGSIRYLRNVMGLWLLQESLRGWGESDVEALVTAAAGEPEFATVVDPDDARFLPTGDMPARIAEFARETGQPVPPSRPAFVRCIIESLALAHRVAVRDAVRLSGHEVEVVHLVGGGSRNGLLCQLTADACGLPVVAGPVEATAMGNVLVQGRALGMVDDLRQMRAMVAASTQVRRYEPREQNGRWDEVASRVLDR